jgi:nucleoside-diphosphate-sugar epimerase
MRILITGAAGFIGGHVIEKVQASGHNILAATLSKDKNVDNRSSVHWIVGDFEDFEFMIANVKSFNPDIVIHLAWQGIPDYSEKISRTNLHNSIKFFEFIFNKTDCRKVLVTGSCWEYGKKQGICKESDPVNIESYFTWAKNSLNQYLQIKCAERKITLNWFRIFYVYGPGQRAGSLIPTLIKSIAAQEIPNIKTPLNKNDFAYVGDVADAIAKAVDTDLPSGVYNLGSGTSTSVYDICRIVEKQLLGTETISNQVLENGQKEEAVNFWADMGKINIFFNNMHTPINDGISNMVGEIR